MITRPRRHDVSRGRDEQTDATTCQSVVLCIVSVVSLRRASLPLQQPRAVLRGSVHYISAAASWRPRPHTSVQNVHMHHTRHRISSNFAKFVGLRSCYYGHCA